MSFKYIDNQVSSSFMAEIEAEAKAAPKSHGLKYFYMRNHYSNLYEYQQIGYHWFYLSGSDEKHCTCGLTVAKDAKVETSLGHLELPSFEGVANVFINYCNFDSSLESYQYGAFCQTCGKGSLRNLLKKEATQWISDHKEDCRVSATN
jgi:hypothetical protein